MQFVRPHRDAGQIYLLETAGLIKWLRDHRPQLAEKYSDHFRNRE
jgi:hypothetical protein